MGSKIIRVIMRASDGAFRTREFQSLEQLLELHEQTGVDDCSTDLSLRGLPLLRGLVGPMPDGKKIAVYESPEVFETLTKEWATAKTKRRRSSAAVAAANIADDLANENAEAARIKKPIFLSIPYMGPTIEAAIVNR